MKTRRTVPKSRTIGSAGILRGMLHAVAVASLLWTGRHLDWTDLPTRIALGGGVGSGVIALALDVVAARRRRRATSELVGQAEAIARGEISAPMAAVRADRGIESLGGALEGVRVTLAREAEARRRSEDEYRSLFDDTRDGVVLSSSDGKILDANRAAIGLLGYANKAEMLSLRTHEVWFSGDHGSEPVAQLLAASNASRDGAEVGLRRRDGEMLSVNAIATRFQDPGGAGVYRTVFRDLSERKNLEARLRQTQKLEAVGMLAAGVAHEINNPLTYVLAHLETIEQDLGTIETRPTPELVLGSIRSRVSEALEGAGRVKRIVRDFKTFSRLEGKEHAPVDINAVVERALQLASSEIRYRAKAHLDLKPVPRVSADEGRLAQVFLNLLINAAQAIPDDALDGEIRVRTGSEGEQVIVDISDTGKGIEPDQLDRLFDPFFTTKPANEGSGLGLSICYNIVTSYSGTIEVESHPGSGSRFTVRLPTGRAQVAAGKAQEEAPITASRVRVLVVDDEPFVLSTVKLILGKTHDVVCCGSAADALQVLDHDRRFDVILSDLMMYRSSGMDLYAALLERSRDLARRMVFMTGGAFTEEAGRFLASIPNVRIDKPFGSAELLNVVNRVAAARARTAGSAPARPLALGERAAGTR